jgi:hypothetical protein
MPSDIAERCECDLCGKVHTQPTPNYCRVSPRPIVNPGVLDRKWCSNAVPSPTEVVGQITSTLGHLDVPHFPTQQWQKADTGPLRDKLLRRAILASGLIQGLCADGDVAIQRACDMDREIERVTREEK